MKFEIEKWFSNPQEGMNLSKSDRRFLNKWQISISTAYIGMVRCYRENGVVFQTSPLAPMLAATSSEILGLDQQKDLSRQLSEWIKSFKDLGDNDIEAQLSSTNLGLF